MEHHELQVRGLYIPFSLFEDDRVSYHDKLLVVIIDMLDNDDQRHCFASNAFLAAKLRSTEASVANGITRLKKVGWVSVTQHLDERRITTLLKIEKPPSQNREDPVLKIEKPLISGRELVDEISSEREEDALSIFRTTFPDFNPNVFQIDQIETLVTDLPRWKKTVKFWVGNGYQARHVDRLIDCYNNGNALPKENDGKPTDRVVIDDISSCPICDNGMQCPHHSKEVANARAIRG
jgi:hypothetical protein